MNYTPTFCLDLEPDDQTRPQTEWPYGYSYLSMAQHQSFYKRQQRQQPYQQDELPEQQQTGLEMASMPLSTADEWGYSQPMLDVSSPSSISTIGSMPPGLTYSAVTLDGPEADLVDLPATSMTSGGSTPSAILSSKPPSLFTSKT